MDCEDMRRNLAMNGNKPTMYVNQVYIENFKCFY
jgi:hypothetical protein